MPEVLPVQSVRGVPCLNLENWPPLPHPAFFHQVLILKVVEVFCFDTLLQVLILNGLTLHQNCAKWACLALGAGILGMWHKVSAKHLPAYLDSL